MSIPVASLKFPPITSISFSSARAKDWDDVLTGHIDESFARSWSVVNKKLGKYSFSTVLDEKDENFKGTVKVIHHYKDGLVN